MTLNEAIAIHLYLRESNELDWNGDVFKASWKVISQEAEKAMGDFHAQTLDKGANNPTNQAGS